MWIDSLKCAYVDLIMDMATSHSSGGGAVHQVEDNYLDPTINPGDQVRRLYIPLAVSNEPRRNNISLYSRLQGNFSP